MTLSSCCILATLSFCSNSSSCGRRPLPGFLRRSFLPCRWTPLRFPLLLLGVQSPPARGRGLFLPLASSFGRNSFLLLRRLRIFRVSTGLARSLFRCFCGAFGFPTRRRPWSIWVSQRIGSRRPLRSVLGRSLLSPRGRALRGQLPPRLRSSLLFVRRLPAVRLLRMRGISTS